MPTPHPPHSSYPSHPPEPFPAPLLADVAPVASGVVPSITPDDGDGSALAPDALSIAELEILREIYREPVPERLTPEVHPSAAPPETAASAVRWQEGASEAAHRIVNVAFAALALVLLAPLMMLIALAVRLSSRGPVIYVQERVGLDRRRTTTGSAAAAAVAAAAFGGFDAAAPLVRHERRREDVGGQPYRMFKFRTMRVDAEAHGRAIWATRDDPRVTRVGRVLRRTRLDELPQLINVLRGEMNIVGPRPERPSIAARLRREVDGYALRYRVRPGITGWAQINHPYDSSIEDVRAKVRYDLEYLSRRSVREDLRIMARTVPVMLGRRSGW
jgi:lipopolysaccharide/colanic/teichoic acid biosynthesis glycosyltransferase